MCAVMFHRHSIPSREPEVEAQAEAYRRLDDKGVDCDFSGGFGRSLNLP